MPSTYTVNLGIEKPATGEQSGTWGDTVNDNSNILDEAINGAVTITLSSAGSSGSPNSITITNGASSTGRNKWIEFGDGGDLGAAAYVQLTPNDAEKICNIRNSLSGNRSIFIFQGNYSASNDLEIAAGTDVVVKFNGGGTGATVVNVYANLKVDGIVATTADINGGTVDGTVIGGAAAAALTATTVVASTSLNIASDGATVTGIKDEDNMSSNSATKLATQQSIKAYVDSQVGTVDTLAEILANGNDTGSNNIDVDGAQKVQFRDSAIFINSSTNGQLDIVADNEIQIAATTIDINGAIVASGDISAASLDISGNVDIDGILNVDAIDIDGAVQLDATLTVGVDDTGYDVKFFGAAGGSFLLWDESANNLSLAGASTLNVAGVVTANAGIVVDNIAIDGNTIDCISGDLTLDVAGDISLDAGGAEIKLKSGGTQFGDIYTSSSHLYIQSSISDKDLNFEVNDGGSIVTALTLDGSAAGSAIFNVGAVFNESGADSDFRVESDGNANMLFVDAGNNKVVMGSSSIPVLNGSSTRTYDLVLDKGVAIGNSPYTHGYIGTDGTDGNVVIAANSYSANLGGSRYVKIVGGTAGGGGPASIAEFNGDTGAVFNEEGLDRDFRVESDGNANMLFVDGGNNRVGIGTAAPDQALVLSAGGLQITGQIGSPASGQTGAMIDYSGGGARYWSRGANGSTRGTINFYQLENDGGNQINSLSFSTSGEATFSSTITGQKLVATNGILELDDNGSHNGIINSPASLFVNIDSDGTNTGELFVIAKDRTATSGGTELFRVQEDGQSKFASGLVVNESSADADFRVESNGNTHMLFVDGGTNQVGINRSSFLNSTVRLEVGGADNVPLIAAEASGVRAGMGVTASNVGFYHNATSVLTISSAGKINTVANGIIETSSSTGSLTLHGGATNKGGTILLRGGNSDSDIIFKSQASTATPQEVARIGPSAMVVNEGSLDYDFRVESNSNTHMLFVDGGANLVCVNASSNLNSGGGSSPGFNVRGGGGGPHTMTLRNLDVSGGANQVEFQDGDGDVCGAINSNATTNTTTYGTSSDYRIKENVSAVADAIDKVKLLHPRTYNFITDPEKNKEDGFIAHELAEVVPNVVTGEKDAVHANGNMNVQQVDYGKLTPLLTAALQEAITKIETLEARIAALES